MIGLAPLLFLAFSVAAGSGPQAGRVPERASLEKRYKWDLADLYADRDAWEADFALCQKWIDKLAGMKQQMAKSPQALLAVLELRDELGVKLERVFAYAMLLRDQDTREADPQAMHDRTRSLGVKYSEATSWIEPGLLAMPDNQLTTWCQENDKLAIYQHAFDDLLRQRRHVLSAREESLLAMAGKMAGTAQQAFTMLANADLKFPTIKDAEDNEVELSEGRYALYLQSPDRGLRERAFKGTLGAYLAFRNTIAATLAGAVERDIFHARTHNYESALQAALDPDNVPVAVYDNLIATVRSHLPKLHRYMEIRRRKLGIDQVHIYDTFVPLVDEEAPTIGYNEAVSTVMDGLAPLGPEYVDPTVKAFGGRWIDVYETQGKRSGAYSMGTYSCHPYILLNYNDTYKDMFTITHEMGHAMHTWFTQRNQPPVYGDYPIFLAEVASTTNEVLLGEYLRKRATTRAEKLFLINLAVENIRGTVVTQTMYAEFEKYIHAEAERGGALTFDIMAAAYRNLAHDYYGPAYAHDEEMDGYWLRIPHFYRGFYVYKYATSYCAAAALAERIMHGEPGALEGYLGFLKSGSSDYPIEILRKAGVDLSTPDPIAATMELFGHLLDELEALLE